MDTVTTKQDLKIRDLFNAIPKHCFRSSYFVSFSYLLRNILGSVALAALAILAFPYIHNSYLYAISWCLYGFTQGLFGTGLWILGHECGHGALFPSQKLNDIVGWFLHSVLFTPYLSWKSTHRQHHIYANHMGRDRHHVPDRRDIYAAKLGVDHSALEELTSDAPGITMFHLLTQQLLGWPLYLMFNLTSGSESTQSKKPRRWWQNSHFDPKSPLFSASDFSSVVISDIGIGLTAAALWHLGQIFGSKIVILLYIGPWLWVNHWIVAITYLQHTHPSLPKYERNSWTFLKGSLATVDRDFGWAGRFFFHNVVDYHVIHHLFPQIPFYHTEKATNAIIPLLGSQYHQEKDSSFLKDLWKTFIECQWVQPEEGGPDGELKFQKGPSPSAKHMIRKLQGVI